jgi:hypothetical protein
MTADIAHLDQVLLRIFGVFRKARKKHPLGVLREGVGRGQGQHCRCRNEHGSPVDSAPSCPDPVHHSCLRPFDATGNAYRFERDDGCNMRIHSCITTAKLVSTNSQRGHPP